MVAGLKRPLPYSAPIKPPTRTAADHQGGAGATKMPLESRPAIPEIELTKMKAAAVPEITRTGAQHMSSISGLRKTPPPTPVSPDRNPSNAPQTRRTGH